MEDFTKNSESIKIDSNTINRKEFIKQAGIGISYLMLMSFLQSCGGVDEIPDPNPTNTTKLDFTIDLTTNTYKSLKTKGSSAIVAAQNVIIAHTNNDTWIAIGSKCSSDQTSLNYRAATNDFVCSKDGSEFTFIGKVQKGPATTDLNKYNTSYDATNSTLRVFA